MKKLKHFLLYFCSISLTLIISHIFAKEILLDKIVAVVNDDIIMQSELNKAIKKWQSNLAQRNITVSQYDTQFRQKILDALIIEKLQLLLAHRMNININDWQINTYLENTAKSTGMSIKKVMQQLTTESSKEDQREELRKKLTIITLQQQQVIPSIKVSESEIDHYLKAQSIAENTQSLQYQINHILIALPDSPIPDEIEQANQKATKIYQQLNAGANFEKTAIKNSSGQNALQGGLLNWMSLHQLPTLFADHIKNMSVNEISKPFKSAAGFHILKLTQQRGNNKTLDQQIQLLHITIKPNSIRSIQQSHLLIKKIHAQLKAGKNFVNLATLYSDDKSFNNSNKEWTSLKSLPENYINIINKTDINQVSEPFHTDEGWHLLKVLNKRKIDISDQIKKENAHKAIISKKFNEALILWINKLKDSSYIDIRN